jgi:signal transduction histidine kinase/ligand-binding sensor domain-containing protein
MLEDRQGVLWIGTEAGGLLRVEGKEVEPVPVSHPEVSSLAEDREGNLWVGTGGGGLNLLHPRVMGVITAKSGLPFESVRSVCEDVDGWIWAAMQNGSLIRGRDSNWSAVTGAEGWPGGDAQCVAPAKEGGVWIGTHDRGLQRLRANELREWGTSEGLSSPTVRSVLAASNGDVWAATDAPSRLHRLRDGQLQGFALPAGTRSIRALAEGVEGTIWAGTSAGHILRVQGNSVVNELGAQHANPSFSVRCLHAARDGSLWIGYAGWGLGRWQGGKYSRVSAAQGLHNDFVSQILEDGLGGLWLTGNRGLFRVQVEELVAVAEGRNEHLRSIAFGRNDGLPSLQPHHENSPSSWRGTNGQLWFATRNGLLAIHAGRISENPVAPPVLLEEIKVDDRLVAQVDSAFPLRAPGSPSLLDLRRTNQVLELAPGHAKIELAYTALSFNSPENVHFRHRLNGFDSEWVEAGTQRSVKYPRLPAGRYEFEVTACNEAGIWNDEGFRFPIVVRPFFWETWWFRGLLLAAFTLGVVATVRYVSFRRLRRQMTRLERQAALDKERARIAKDLHDDLGASMTQMTLLLELAMQHRSEPEAAMQRVDDGLRASREAIKSLDAAVWAVNPTNNTLPELVAYIGQFGMEFLQQAGIRCELDLPDHPPERPVSSELRHNLFLIAKEALNNIVRHAQARVVCLSIAVTPATLELGIADDGAGIDQVPHDALADGLRNMRQRAGEMNARFSLESEPGKGTRITVSYPWSADH